MKRIIRRACLFALTLLCTVLTPSVPPSYASTRIGGNSQFGIEVSLPTSTPLNPSSTIRFSWRIYLKKPFSVAGSDGGVTIRPHIHVQGLNASNTTINALCRGSGSYSAATLYSSTSSSSTCVVNQTLRLYYGKNALNGNYEIIPAALSPSAGYIVTIDVVRESTGTIEASIPFPIVVTDPRATNQFDIIDVDAPSEVRINSGRMRIWFGVRLKPSSIYINGLTAGARLTESLSAVSNCSGGQVTSSGNWQCSMLPMRFIGSSVSYYYFDLDPNKLGCYSLKFQMIRTSASPAYSVADKTISLCVRSTVSNPTQTPES